MDCNYEFLKSGTLSISGLECDTNGMCTPTKRINAEMLWNIRVNVGDFDLYFNDDKVSINNICEVDKSYYSVYCIDEGFPSTRKIHGAVALKFRD